MTKILDAIKKQDFAVLPTLLKTMSEEEFLAELTVQDEKGNNAFKLATGRLETITILFNEIRNKFLTPYLMATGWRDEILVTRSLRVQEAKLNYKVSENKDVEEIKGVKKGKNLQQQKPHTIEKEVSLRKIALDIARTTIANAVQDLLTRDWTVLSPSVKAFASWMAAEFENTPTDCGLFNPEDIKKFFRKFIEKAPLPSPEHLWLDEYNYLAVGNVMFAEYVRVPAEQRIFKPADIQNFILGVLAQPDKSSDRFKELCLKVGNFLFAQSTEFFVAGQDEQSQQQALKTKFSLCLLFFTLADPGNKSTWSNLEDLQAVCYLQLMGEAQDCYPDNSPTVFLKSKLKDKVFAQRFVKTMLSESGLLEYHEGDDCARGFHSPALANEIARIYEVAVEMDISVPGKDATERMLHYLKLAADQGNAAAIERLLKYQEQLQRIEGSIDNALAQEKIRALEKYRAMQFYLGIDTEKDVSKALAILVVAAAKHAPNVLQYLEQLAQSDPQARLALIQFHCNQRDYIRDFRIYKKAWEAFEPLLATPSEENTKILNKILKLILEVCNEQIGYTLTRFREAIDFLTKLADKQNIRQAQIALGKYYFQNEDYAEAVRWLFDQYSPKDLVCSEEELELFNEWEIFTCIPKRRAVEILEKNITALTKNGTSKSSLKLKIAELLIMNGGPYWTSISYSAVGKVLRYCLEWFPAKIWPKDYCNDVISELDKDPQHQSLVRKLKRGFAISKLLANEKITEELLPYIDLLEEPRLRWSFFSQDSHSAYQQLPEEDRRLALFKLQLCSIGSLKNYAEVKQFVQIQYLLPKSVVELVAQRNSKLFYAAFSEKDSGLDQKQRSYIAIFVVKKPNIKAGDDITGLLQCLHDEKVRKRLTNKEIVNFFLYCFKNFKNDLLKFIKKNNPLFQQLFYTEGASLRLINWSEFLSTLKSHVEIDPNCAAECLNLYNEAEIFDLVEPKIMVAILVHHFETFINKKPPGLALPILQRLIDPKGKYFKLLGNNVIKLLIYGVNVFPELSIKPDLIKKLINTFGDKEWAQNDANYQALQIILGRMYFKNGDRLQAAYLLLGYKRPSTIPLSVEEFSLLNNITLLKKLCWGNNDNNPDAEKLLTSFLNNKIDRIIADYPSSMNLDLDTIWWFFNTDWVFAALDTSTRGKLLAHCLKNYPMKTLQAMQPPIREILQKRSSHTDYFKVPNCIAELLSGNIQNGDVEVYSNTRMLMAVDIANFPIVKHPQSPYSPEDVQIAQKLLKFCQNQFAEDDIRDFIEYRHLLPERFVDALNSTHGPVLTNEFCKASVVTRVEQLRDEKSTPPPAKEVKAEQVERISLKQPDNSRILANIVIDKQLRIALDGATLLALIANLRIRQLFSATDLIAVIEYCSEKFPQPTLDYLQRDPGIVSELVKVDPKNANLQKLKLLLGKFYLQKEDYKQAAHWLFAHVPDNSDHFTCEDEAVKLFNNEKIFACVKPEVAQRIVKKFLPRFLSTAADKIEFNPKVVEQCLDPKYGIHKLLSLEDRAKIVIFCFKNHPQIKLEAEFIENIVVRLNDGENKASLNVIAGRIYLQNKNYAKAAELLLLGPLPDNFAYQEEELALFNDPERFIALFVNGANRDQALMILRKNFDALLADYPKKTGLKLEIAKHLLNPQGSFWGPLKYEEFARLATFCLRNYSPLVMRDMQFSVDDICRHRESFAEQKPAFDVAFYISALLNNKPILAKDVEHIKKIALADIADFPLVQQQVYKQEEVQRAQKLVKFFKGQFSVEDIKDLLQGLHLLPACPEIVEFVSFCLEADPQKLLEYVQAHEAAFEKIFLDSLGYSAERRCKGYILLAKIYSQLKNYTKAATWLTKIVNDGYALNEEHIKLFIVVEIFSAMGRESALTFVRRILPKLNFDAPEKVIINPEIIKQLLDPQHPQKYYDYLMWPETSVVLLYCLNSYPQIKFEIKYIKKIANALEEGAAKRHLEAFLSVVDILCGKAITENAVDGLKLINVSELKNFPVTTEPSYKPEDIYRAQTLIGFCQNKFTVADIKDYVQFRHLLPQKAVNALQEQLKNIFAASAAKTVIADLAKGENNLSKNTRILANILMDSTLLATLPVVTVAEIFSNAEVRKLLSHEETARVLLHCLKHSVPQVLDNLGDDSEKILGCLKPMADFKNNRAVQIMLGKYYLKQNKTSDAALWLLPSVSSWDVYNRPNYTNYFQTVEDAKTFITCRSHLTKSTASLAIKQNKRFFARQDVRTAIVEQANFALRMNDTWLCANFLFDAEVRSCLDVDLAVQLYARRDKSNALHDSEYQFLAFVISQKPEFVLFCVDELKRYQSLNRSVSQLEGCNPSIRSFFYTALAALLCIDSPKPEHDDVTLSLLRWLKLSENEIENTFSRFSPGVVSEAGKECARATIRFYDTLYTDDTVPSSLSHPDNFPGFMATAKAICSAKPVPKTPDQQAKWMSRLDNRLTHIITISHNNYVNSCQQNARKALQEVFSESVKAADLSSSEYISCFNALIAQFQNHRSRFGFGRTETMKRASTTALNELADSRTKLLAKPEERNIEIAQQRQVILEKGLENKVEKTAIVAVKELVENDKARLQVRMVLDGKKPWPIGWFHERRIQKKIDVLSKLNEDIGYNEFKPDCLAGRINQAIKEVQDISDGQTAINLKQCLRLAPIDKKLEEKCNYLIRVSMKLQQLQIAKQEWRSPSAISFLGPSIIPQYIALRKAFNSIMDLDKCDNVEVVRVLQTEARLSPEKLGKLYAVVEKIVREVMSPQSGHKSASKDCQELLQPATCRGVKTPMFRGWQNNL